MKKDYKIKIIFYITILLMIILSMSNAIYINPTVETDLQIQIDNPLETYYFDAPINLSQRVRASNYVGFNDTFF